MCEFHRIIVCLQNQEIFFHRSLDNIVCILKSNNFISNQHYAEVLYNLDTT